MLVFFLHSFVFVSQFLPQSNDSLIVSGAADHKINVHDLTRKETTHVFTYHMGRVKRIATSPNIPYIFWSAAEDGTVMYELYIFCNIMSNSYI